MDTLTSNKIVDIYEYVQHNNVSEIIKTVSQCFEHNMLSQKDKCNLLACAIATNNNLLENYLFASSEYGLMELLKTCFILDTGRYIKLLKRKLELLEKQKSKQKKINYFQKEIKHNEKLDQGMGQTKGFGLTGTKIKRIKKKYINNLTKEQLEESIANMPVRQWQRLANMLHLAQNDFQLDWFLTYLFDNSKAPETSLIYKINNLTEENMKDMLVANHIKYSILRQVVKEKKIKISDECKKILCEYTCLEDLVWYWEELKTEYVNEYITTRITSENLNFGNGKILERLLTVRENGALNLYQKMIEIAEKKMYNLKLYLKPPVVILGDASGSMEVAIKVSSIISSLLCNICDADLRFFNDHDKLIDPPKNVTEVIKVATECKADGSTAPAASLYPYYEQKIKVHTIVLITDEEENTQCNGYNFAPLFKKYTEEICDDVRLAFISFTKPGVDGQMVKEIKQDMPSYGDKILTFKMNRKCPDLTKLDKILFTLSKI